MSGAGGGTARSRGAHGSTPRTSTAAALVGAAAATARAARASPPARAATVHRSGTAAAVLALVTTLACAPAQVPWTGGGVAPTSAADRRVADTAELWLATTGAPAETRARTAEQVLRDLARLPPAEISRPYALDARLLALEARRFLARGLTARARFEIERGAPLPPPEELATLRACLAHVLGSTAPLASCAMDPATEPGPADGADASAAAGADASAAPGADASAAAGADASAAPGAHAQSARTTAAAARTSTTPLTVADLLHRAATSPYASSPIRQAAADPRIVDAWRLLLADTVTATTADRPAILAVVRPALAELGRYEPGNATWTLFAALWMLEAPPGPPRPLRARLEHDAEQGLIPPWLLD